MPVHRTTDHGKPAYQWGETGHKYTYTPGNEASRQEAKRKAEAQGRAVRASQARQRAHTRKLYVPMG